MVVTYNRPLLGKSAEKNLSPLFLLRNSGIVSPAELKEYKCFQLYQTPIRENSSAEKGQMESGAAVLDLPRLTSFAGRSIRVWERG